jgi:alpha-beta hydrolase superfamily lysophospholipase
MKRSWQSIPAPVDRQLYRGRIEWRWYARFLPSQMQLSGENIPEESWWNWRGIDVHVDRLANPDARAVVVLLHGGGGNGRVVMLLGPLLRSLGLEVVAPDLPGYGLTERKVGIVPTYDMWADLAADFADEERRRRSLPVVVFGLSLGGLLGYGAAARTKRIAGVMASTLVDTRVRPSFAHIARLPALARLGAPLLGVLPRPLARVRVPIDLVAKMHYITNDPEFSAVFRRDVLAGGASVTLGFLASLKRFDIRVEPEQFTETPVLVVHPALDPWTPAGLSRPFFDRIAAEKYWVDLEGCGHLPYEEPGVHQMTDAISRFIAKVVRSKEPRRTRAS